MHFDALIQLLGRGPFVISSNIIPSCSLLLSFVVVKTAATCSGYDTDLCFTSFYISISFYEGGFYTTFSTRGIHLKNYI